MPGLATAFAKAIYRNQRYLVISDWLMARYGYGEKYDTLRIAFARRYLV